MENIIYERQMQPSIDIYKSENKIKGHDADNFFSSSNKHFEK